MRSISIVIPARNEEVHLPRCLAAIETAKQRIAIPVETVVVLNRCTDGTEAVAREAGCLVVPDDSKNLSRIRNAGAMVASGDILITVDADSTMSPRMLQDVLGKLSSGRIVGGGVFMVPDRWSMGILCTGLCLVPLSLWYGGISGGLFYCLREDFLAIGGFDENRVSAEDIDFAYRLKKRGRKKRQRFSTILTSHIVTSSRKFDELGDWYFFKHPKQVLTALRGRDQSVADEYWYDFKR